MHADESTPDGPGPVPCERFREWISAAADDELTTSEELLLALHLEGCPPCSGHAERVAVLTRSIRVRPAVAGPDPVAAVLARSRPPRLGRGGWLRPALAWVGVVVAVQSVPPLVFGELDGTPTHVARHVGASALALAIGLLYAAWRPTRAFGLVPLVAALFAATLAAAVLDTVGGERTAGAESVHVAELVGMILLWFVAGSPGLERLGGAIRLVRRDPVVRRTTS